MVGITELVVKRVAYGKANTPVELREYVAGFSAAVGNCEDWKAFALANNYSQVKFIEKDGQTWGQCVFKKEAK
jgi:hypothetical protein